MADLHESLVRWFRKNLMPEGFKESKSPMPTFRPDVFAEKTSKHGAVLEQVAVEAEITSTIFSEHTSHQLLKMNEYMQHQRSKRVRVRGFLLVPKGKQVRAHAEILLGTLFPWGTQIRVLEAPKG